MDPKKLSGQYRVAFLWMVFCAMAGVFISVGLSLSFLITVRTAVAAEKRVRTVYAKKTELDFEGTQIEGELKNPAEFYFQRKPEEKFDSLVKRRRNFHREMLRDVVLSK